jgi:ketosteroid isomerase-like protein
VETREAAKRWADTWAEAWPRQDVEAIAALQADDGDHWASMFRPYRGRAGLRTYLTECFAEETRPAEVWFAEPQVDGDAAAVEYWAICYLEEKPTTISGCTVLRFDEAGLVAEARDYSHVRQGRHTPLAGLFD